MRDSTKTGVPLQSRPAAIIHNKCRVPPVSERLVERHRLDHQIGELVSAHNPVTVYATAGSGKTTAVVQALGSFALPAAWLTVDETDAAPGRLLTYLEAALAIQVPEVSGVATWALRQSVPHREAAGLLAESVGERPTLLVIDELERIASSADALAVIAAFVRYCPPALHVILVSRQELALDLGTRALLAAAALDERDLAFTVEEAAKALPPARSSGIDPAEAVEATGGWVTGVLFEAWRSEDHVVGIGGEADPLHGYLGSQVLDQLSSEERDFLISTSLLTDVTATKARALGQPGAATLLAGLRTRHLPVTWEPDGRTMRCHTRLREYLVTLLERKQPPDVAVLRCAYGALLEDEGHFEDAVEEYLRAGAPELALHAAEGALDAVVARLDFSVAERWLHALRSVAPPGDGTLTRAELMLAIAHERYGEGARIADRLVAVGKLGSVVRSSFRAATMIAWCYWHAGRLDESRAVVAAAEAAGGGPRIDVLHDMFTLVDDHKADSGPGPELDGGPLDALILRVRYARGKLPGLADSPVLPWAAAVSAPWRVGTLRAMGHTAEALELYGADGLAEWAPVWFHAIVEPELMIDLGRPTEARAALERGRVLIRESESVAFEMLNRLIETKLELRLAGDHERAWAVLQVLEAMPEARTFGFIAEQISTWAGMVLLRRDEDVAAARRLRRSVRTMVRNERILELPTAGVLLAEAESRLGNAKAAARAAAVALAAAARQGSNHILLQALDDFPAVLAREVEAEHHADSIWHELGRALMSRGTSAVHVAPNDRAVQIVVFLHDLGPPRLVVDGVEVRPRIKKSYELAAYLAARGCTEVERDELLGALFDGRADESTRSYLRQAAYQLREVLPDGAGPSFEASRLRLGPEVMLQSQSEKVEELLARAARVGESERYELLSAAIASLDSGEYLAGIDSPWVEARRARLGHESADARHEAAKLACAAGRYRDAERLANTVLRDDPYREATWRVLMRVAHATGDDDRVLEVYRRCARTLGELATAPTASTRELLGALRS